MKTVSASLVLVVLLGFGAFAGAGTIGGTPITVTCDTTITVTDANSFQTLTLDGTDPILSSVCPKNGITIKNQGKGHINRGFFLDCQTNQSTPITGSTKDAGIELMGPNLFVSNCYVTGFKNGITSNGDGVGIQDSQVQNSADDGFVVKSSVGLKNANIIGITFAGNRAFDTGGWGFNLHANLIGASPGSFFNNIADGNASGGFLVKGEGVGLFGGEAFNNGGPGFSITSSSCCSAAFGQFLTSALAVGNAGPGIIYSAKNDGSNCVGSIDPACAGGTFFPLGFDTTPGAIVSSGNGGTCPTGSLPFLPGVCPIVKGAQCSDNALNHC